MTERAALLIMLANQQYSLLVTRSQKRAWGADSLLSCMRAGVAGLKSRGAVKLHPEITLPLRPDDNQRLPFARLRLLYDGDESCFPAPIGLVA